MVDKYSVLRDHYNVTRLLRWQEAWDGTDADGWWIPAAAGEFDDINQIFEELNEKDDKSE